MSLESVKADRDLLLKHLGITLQPGMKSSHLKCPFHESKNTKDGELSVYLTANNTWQYKCFSCQEAGSVVDAVMKLRGVSFQEAMQVLGVESHKFLPQKKVGFSIREKLVPSVRQIDQPKKTKSNKPVPDERIESFIAKSSSHLVDGEFCLDFMINQRGIVDSVIKKHKIGICRIIRDADGLIENCRWSIPIFDEEGKPCAVKLHWQFRPDDNTPKCNWMKFGTVPAENPRHAYITTYPTHQIDGEEVYLCAGELKALAMESMGLPAICSTGAESSAWTDDMLAVLKNKTVILVPDIEPNKKRKSKNGEEEEFNPGLDYARMMERSLTGIARKIYYAIPQPTDEDLAECP